MAKKTLPLPDLQDTDANAAEVERDFNAALTKILSAGKPQRRKAVKPSGKAPQSPSR